MTGEDLSAPQTGTTTPQVRREFDVVRRRRRRFLTQKTWGSHDFYQTFTREHVEKKYGKLRKPMDIMILPSLWDTFQWNLAKNLWEITNFYQ